MINFKESTSLLAYVLVCLASVGAAFYFSTQFLAVSGAQTPAPESPPIGQGLPAPPPAPAVPTTGTGSVEVSNKNISDLEGFLEPFIYDVLNRRDPFQPYAEFKKTEDTAPSEAPRSLSPAQRFDLDQLKLVGIMWDVKEPKAMFMDPQQEVLVLGRDESVGNRNGYIAAIREGEVVVVEAQRKKGDILYRTRVLRIER